MDLGLRGEWLAETSDIGAEQYSVGDSITPGDGMSGAPQLRMSFGDFLWLYAQHTGLSIPRANVEGVWVPTSAGIWTEVKSQYILQIKYNYYFRYL